MERGTGSARKGRISFSLLEFELDGKVVDAKNPLLSALLCFLGEKGIQTGQHSGYVSYGELTFNHLFVLLDHRLVQAKTTGARRDTQL